MTSLSSLSRLSIVAEVIAFAVLIQLVRWGFFQVTPRYAGPLALAVILLAIGIYLRYRSISFSHIGLKSLRWPKGVLWLLPQILLAFIFIGVSAAAAHFVGNALGLSAFTSEQPDPQERWGSLFGNTPLYLSWLAVLWFAGPAEELFFRGYLISRLSDVLGKSGLALTMSVFLPALFFGFGHVYYQGWRGLFVTGAIGLTLGVLFLLYRRNIWPLMIAHAAFNSMVFTGLYLGADF